MTQDQAVQELQETHSTVAESGESAPKAKKTRTPSRTRKPKPAATGPAEAPAGDATPGEESAAAADAPAAAATETSPPTPARRRSRKSSAQPEEATVAGPLGAAETGRDELSTPPAAPRGRKASSTPRAGRSATAKAKSAVPEPTAEGLNEGLESLPLDSSIPSPDAPTNRPSRSSRGRKAAASSHTDALSQDAAPEGHTEDTASSPGSRTGRSRSSGRSGASKSRKANATAPAVAEALPSSPAAPLLEDAMEPVGESQAELLRKKPSRKGRGKGDQDILFQPEEFADIYPSMAEAVLPGEVLVAPVSPAAEQGNGLEDDGPQPTLPGQPSLALPQGMFFEELPEDALAALDEQINGNRIEAESRQPTGAKARNGRKAPAGKKAKRNAPPVPDAEAVSSPVAEALEGEPAAAAPEAKGASGKKGKAASKAVEKSGSGAPRRMLYVSEIPDEQVEVVITENGQVTEYFVEMAHQAKIRGNIYKGVINNVDTNLQAAFVNFGGGKNGFLQIDEVHPEYWLTYHDSSRGPKYPPIHKVLKVGQEVLVQVVKEPSGTKGAFLTTWISLAGRFLVLTPGQEQIGVSRKVEDAKERARLRELLTGIQPGEDLGVIIRTASEGAGKTSIQKDLQFLKRLWKDIRKKGMTEKSPALLYQEADLASRAVRDYLAEDIHEIWVDSQSTLDSITETTTLLFPRRTDMVKLHQDSRQTLWERFNLQRQLEEVTSREVVLPSGGRLVFDQTEALMAIDINSGKTQGKTSFEEMVFRTNMEAAEAIARHLRLRDIGGQVVIDFIEMRDRGHCRDVEKTLRNAMRQDRARHDVGRMSSFGLLELVRQRTGTSAISISSEPCPHCRGTGVRRNMEWQALHALRDLQAKLAKASSQGKVKKTRCDNGNGQGTYLFEVDYELSMYLLNKKRDRLTDLEHQFSLHIEIVPKR